MRPRVSAGLIVGRRSMLNLREMNCKSCGIKSPQGNKLQGKSWLLAVFCCVRCILYPGTKVCIASGTRGQSINVLEKIKMELMPMSPLLRNEIGTILISTTAATVEFKNGSSIKVVTASDSARSNRANILLVDEFRMVNKDTIDTVLRRFLTAPRMPGYLHKKEYAHLKERNKEIYLSSAFFKSHWSYEKIKDYARNMLDSSKRYFVCGLPYQLSIAENLLDSEAVADEMSEAGFNSTRWSISISVLLKPIEPIAYGVCCRSSANRGTLSAEAYDNPVPSQYQLTTGEVLCIRYISTRTLLMVKCT